MGVMSYEDPNGLDYVDETYDWNRTSEDEAPDLVDADAEFLALLNDSSNDPDADGQEGDGDDLLAELDAALGEIEAEIRAEAQELARPSADAVELLPTWERIYKVGSQNFICADRITSAPKLESKKDSTHKTPRRDLSELLGQNLNRARMAREQRKVN